MKDVFILNHFTIKTLYQFGAVVLSFVALDECQLDAVHCGKVK